MSILCRFGIHEWVTYTMEPDPLQYSNFKRVRVCDRCRKREFSGRGPSVAAHDDNVWREGGYEAEGANFITAPYRFP